ncbi:MAG: type II secretion system F family protein [Acidobacteria bacterium]|nr:MAG: type II secretion system F family protein [Acidobacteriota bacterium]
MAEYVCKLGTGAGRVLHETRQALSEEELRRHLAAEGYYVFSIEPRRALKLRLSGAGRERIPQDEFLVFNQQFLTLSKSGLPLQKSLELLARQTRSEALRTAVESVTERARTGALLSESFEAVGMFPKVYCATLRAGERSGNLDRVLGQYIAYQKVSRSFRKKLLSALVYPTFLMVALTFLIGVVVWWIIPKFALLYSDLNAQLPPLTLAVIGFSLTVKRFAGVILIGIPLTIVGLRAALRAPRMRLLLERLKYRLPLAGKLLLKFSVAEFARTLATLLQGGIPIVSALETTRLSVSSPLLSKAIAQVQEEVTGGRSIASALRLTGFFPAIALDMVEVGEATGALPGMLESVAEFFEEDVNIDLATLVAFVDPVMLGAIASVVAFVLIAFYLPLFSLAAQVQ